MIRSRFFLACNMQRLLTVLAVAPTPVARADASPDAKGHAERRLSARTPITVRASPFKINHLGFSHYAGRFDKMEATLNFNNGAPEQSALDVTVYPNSINANNAKLEEEFCAAINFFDVIKYPRASFQSTKIERTGPTTGKITGDFTFLGQTHPITLDVTLDRRRQTADG